MSGSAATSVTLLALVAALLTAAGAGLAWLVLRRRDLGTSADRTTFATLNRAAQAAPHLREGLTPTGAERAVRHLRALLGTPAVAIADGARTLAWDGFGAGSHSHQAVDLASGVLHGGRTEIKSGHDVDCAKGDCPLRSAVVSPLICDERVVGALIAYAPDPTAGLVRATEEVAQWVSTQLDLAELDHSRTRAMEAELRALRAQISPHFIYNSLAAIASFVRTDPERARDLLLEFADFSRYALRRGGEFTTLADELRNVERYLVLEQARFGERLQVQLQVAPEVLPVAVPFLAVQPLVENAVQHGLERKTGVGRITLGAQDAGAEALIWIEDNGEGSDPEVVRRVLSGESEADSVGMGNVDARLRQVFGDDYGLVVETAPGAGTRVSFRVPKFAADVRPG